MRTAHLSLLPLLAMPVGLRQRAELADAGLEPPGVEREAQLGQLARDAEVVRIERPKWPGSRHVGHRAILADRHQSSPRPKASRIRAAASARSCGRIVSFFMR